MLKKAIAISLIATMITSCQSTYTGKMLGIVKDSASMTVDGAGLITGGEVGIGTLGIASGALLTALTTALVPFAAVADVVTLGGTLSGDQVIDVMTVGATIAAAKYDSDSNSYTKPQSLKTPAVNYPSGRTIQTTSAHPPSGWTTQNTSTNHPIDTASKVRSDGWLYDDYNYGQCISIEPVPYNSTSKLAYGTYYIVNRCNVDLDLLYCTGQDRADGTPDNSYNLVRSNRCAGGGLGGISIKANGRHQGKTWFPYNNIGVGYYACKTSWSIVNGATQRTPNDLGESTRCRKYQSQSK